MTTARGEVSPAVVQALRSICLALPDVQEEEAWVGTRWCIRKRNFAHVVAIESGWPPAYAQAAGSDGPITVLTFRAPEEDMDVFASAGHPFFVPRWFADIVGMVLDEKTDWARVAEFVTDSYCQLAPKRLAALVNRSA